MSKGRQSTVWIEVHGRVPSPLILLNIGLNSLLYATIMMKYCTSSVLPTLLDRVLLLISKRKDFQKYVNGFYGWISDRSHCFIVIRLLCILCKTGQLGSILPSSAVTWTSLLKPLVLSIDQNVGNALHNKL